MSNNNDNFFSESFGLDPEVLSKQKNAVDQVKEIVIHHPSFQVILQEIYKCHMMSQDSSKPDCMCIFGDSGTGKTTVLEYYRDKFPRRKEEERDIIPVLLVELPSGAKPKDVASKILFSMKDPLFDIGTEKTMKARIFHLVEKCDVKLLVLDEFQHVNDSENKRVKSNVADWIKGLVNEIKIPVILSGIPTAESLLKINEQLDTRFTNRQRFSTFSYDKSFRGFLKTVDEKLPFPVRSQLASPELSQKLFYASAGNLRVLMRTIERAVCEAVAADREHVAEDDLFVAFSQIDLSSRPHVVNPFNDDKFNFKVAMIEEKKKLKK
ncbi:TniB family NTP-binding protein [Paenibacillus glycanilyticus]|uniref:Transposase n=1 Tax=Paenibacillus glycanilyticus TaxID=126569 RepID=A0ABQ6GIM6_9BACL|nr:TniB family NTP-binding protein [Paenibacillus glycanilyticus]GLX70801.1 transposase [Paenibacillus glycanilyticus]